MSCHLAPVRGHLGQARLPGHPVSAEQVLCPSLPRSHHLSLQLTAEGVNQARAVQRVVQVQSSHFP